MGLSFWIRKQVRRTAQAFSSFKRSVHEAFGGLYSRLRQFYKSHKKEICIFVACFIAGMILTSLLVHPILAAMGFSATGPILGSAAAGIQAGIGNVTAGSFFATMQSISMGGAIPLAWNLVGGLAVGAVGALSAMFWGASKDGKGAAAPEMRLA